MARTFLNLFVIFPCVLMAAIPTPLLAQEPERVLTAEISGTIENELDDEDYDDFTVYARRLEDGQLYGRSAIGADGGFSFTGMPLGVYVIELVNADGWVVCTETNIPATRASPAWVDVELDCGAPLGWLLLRAAGLGGVVAGVVTAPPASGSQ